MNAALFNTLFHAALLLAGTVAFVVWGFAGFPLVTIVRGSSK